MPALRVAKSDDSLAVAVQRLEDGHVDADLGRQLFKQRIARPRHGARSGFRAFISWESEQFFNMASPRRSAPTSRQRVGRYADAGDILLALDEEDLAHAVDEGELLELRSLLMQRKTKSRTKAKMAPRKGEATKAVFETMAGLPSIGLVDQATLRRFDERHLTVAQHLSGPQIQKLRKEAGVSQGVFARYFNVQPTLVSAWERGKRKPSGPARKLLSIVKRKGLDAIA